MMHIVYFERISYGIASLGSNHREPR